MTLRRGDGAVRHRQARPPLRPRDPGRDRDHARRRSSASSPARRSCATSSRRGRSRARSSRGSRRSRRSGARRGSPTSSTTSRARCARRSRSSSPKASSAAFAAEPGSTVLFAAGDEALVARVLGGLRTHLGRELDLAETGAEVFHWVIDFPLFERDEETRQLDVPPPSVHRAGAGRRGQGRVRPGRRARASTTT